MRKLSFCDIQNLTLCNIKIIRSCDIENLAFCDIKINSFCDIRNLTFATLNSLKHENVRILRDDVQTF